MSLIAPCDVFGGKQAVDRKLAVENWKEFIKLAQSVFDRVQDLVHDGKNISYIPILELQVALKHFLFPPAACPSGPVPP